MVGKSTTPIENGHGREDIDLLWSIKVKLKETLCPLGDASWPVAAAIRHRGI
jgi:hypothetical protein